MTSKPASYEPPRIASFRELRSYLAEDYAANGRSVWSPGFQALFAYRLGVWRNGLGFRLGRMLVTLVQAPLAWIARSVYGINLPPRARIGRRLTIAHQHGIVVHGRTVIGDDCTIRQGVTIGAARSGPQPPPVLGDRVEVAAGAVIAGPIRIGEDTIIGPNAVVLQNVPPRSVVAPPPARIMAQPPRRAPEPHSAPDPAPHPAPEPVAPPLPEPAAAAARGTARKDVRP